MSFGRNLHNMEDKSRKYDKGNTWKGKCTTFPKEVEHDCSALSPRTGYVTINVKGEDYKMYSTTSPKNTYELVYMPQEEKGWSPDCCRQNLGPDIIISNNVYTNYTKLL